MLNETAEQEQVRVDQLDPLLMRTFSIIIPAYNEETRIRSVLIDVSEYIAKHNLPWQVIISIDGTDGTGDIVDEISQMYPFVKSSRSMGRNGKGGAVKRVISYVQTEYCILMDADNALPFETILANISQLKDADILNFDRYKDTDNYIPFLRRFVSRGFNLYVKIILGLNVNDTQSGYKIIDTQIAKKIFNKLTITNGFFQPPMFFYAKKIGALVKEVPVKYAHNDDSRFDVSTMMLGGFLTILFFRIINSPLSKLVPKTFIRIYWKKFRWI
jgi:glycosyltransferase involved in cell wall biosynthesis